MRTNYVDCLVTVVIEALLMFWSGENFTYVCFKFASPAFLFDFDIAEYLLKPPLEVKDISFLSRVHACYTHLV